MPDSSPGDTAVPDAPELDPADAGSDAVEPEQASVVSDESPAAAEDRAAEELAVEGPAVEEPALDEAAPEAEAAEVTEDADEVDEVEEFRARLITLPGDWYVVHTYAGY